MESSEIATEKQGIEHQLAAIALETHNNGLADSSSPRPDAEMRDISTNKGNEDKKIFVGGIAYNVTNEDLTQYFSQYGEVLQAQVKYDRNTGRSRGFAFVEFGTSDACRKALQNREQSIQGKQVEVKPAKSRENKKVFVGGLPADHPEEELRAHFEQFGKVEDVEWPYDKTTKARRNFAFVVFEEEEAADRASAMPKQQFGTRECDVKKAVPQGKRFIGMTRGGGAMRGAYGGGFGMGRGGGTNWYAGGGAGGWGQMYGGQYAGNAWGDWYAANFYGQGNGATPYGNYGTDGTGAYGGSGNYSWSGANNTEESTRPSTGRLPSSTATNATAAAAWGNGYDTYASGANIRTNGANQRFQQQY